MSAQLFAQFAVRAGLPDGPSLRLAVNAVQAIPYGRPGSRTPEGVIGEWKGTCSTKHALLARLLAERWPGLRLRLVHRLYRAERAAVLQRHGPVAAATVPEGGLADVRRYLVITLNGQDVIIDVTFPGDPPWDGVNQCGGWPAVRAWTSRRAKTLTLIRQGSRSSIATRGHASRSSPHSREDHQVLSQPPQPPLNHAALISQPHSRRMMRLNLLTSADTQPLLNHRPERTACQAAPAKHAHNAVTWGFTGRRCWARTNVG